MAKAERPRPYLLFILILSVLSLAALAVETTVPLDRESRDILDYADFVVCALFFLDFLVCLYKAESKARYLLTWGWLDLLSSVPAVAPLRWGRAARLVRILRILRVVRSARVLSTLILEKRSQSAVLAATLFTIVLVVSASVAALHVEGGAPGANIQSAEDAAWWALCTITTIGYGDRYPVTSEGRLIGVVLMVAGVGIFGAFAGFIASWFLKPAERKETGELEGLRREVAEWKELVEKLARGLGR
jgi:voltage-gated potassium channel